MTRTLVQGSLPPPQETGGAFVPLRHLGAGPDGSSVLARTASGELVELRLLTNARRGTPRFLELEAALRAHAMLTHPSVRTLSDVSATDPPVVILDWPGEITLKARIEEGPVLARHAMQLAEEIAHAAGAAHRMGLVHGMLVPSLVHLDEHGRAKIEMTGVRTWEAAALEALDRACIAPEHDREPADAGTDVYAIGAILFAMLLGREHTEDERRNAAAVARGALGTLIAAMLSHERDARPSAAEVVLNLREIARASANDAMTMARGVMRNAPQSDAIRDTFTPEQLTAALEKEGRNAPPRSIGPGEQLGRFQIIKRLGEGGMGEVFEAMDLADGRSVAVKVLRPHLANDVNLFRRFRREARTLAQVRNPFVANVVDVNFDRGVHYIALEYVAGPTVAHVQDRMPGHKVAERDALEIVADACRALATPHRHGVIHRDIKPENMMFVNVDLSRVPAGAKVKVCDFGIARSAEDGERKETVQVTQEGMVLGTPMFMSPEQCQASAVSPATDVYSLGVTLYLLLSGKPPFDADDPLALLLKHLNDPPPPLSSLAPDVSDASIRIVERALAKDPKDRFPDAGEMLDAIEKVLRGEPTEIEAHPPLPPASKKVREFKVEMDLGANSEDLWPYVCNSERLNRAVGVGAPKYETRGLSTAREDVVTKASTSAGGTTLVWNEEPFEWVEGRRWGSLRRYESGPFNWMMVDTELTPRPGGGTRVMWRMRYVPRNWLMNLAVLIEMKLKQLGILRRVFGRIDALLTGKLPLAPENDVYEKAPAKLAREVDERVQKIAGELVRSGLDAPIVEHVTSYVRRGSDFEMARIRPLEFAERFGLDPEKAVGVFLHAARAGLFELNWDVLCPLCRVPSGFKDSLKAIEEHAHCPTCNLDYDLDFARSIELVFQVSPRVRASERRRYCVGGPFLFPHVAAQLRLKPKERFVLTLGLEAGQHRLRSPQLAHAMEIKVSPSGMRHRLDLELGEYCPREGDHEHLAPGEQHLVLTNTLDREMIVRVERMAQRTDALTAARASSMAVFRELFPDQVLAPGQLVSLTNASFVRTEVEGASAIFARLGDPKGFELLMRHVRAMNELCAKNGGTVIKTVGAGVLAAFEKPESAARVALELHSIPGSALRVRASVHQGPVMAATLNDKLDYFGQTIAALDALLARTDAGCTALSQSICDEGAIREMLRAMGLSVEGQKTLAIPGHEPSAFGIVVRSAAA